MKFVLSFLAVASLVAAQNPLNDIPDCAKGCVGQNLGGSSIAGCNQLDYKCICSNEDFINKIACCLAPVCDDKGKADTIALANRLCKAFDVNLPTAVVCQSGASASSTAASTASTGSATSSSNASKTTGASSSAASNGAAASTTSKPNAAPTNVAGIVGAAAALAFAL